MFSKLFDLQFHRTALQALGFYIAYLLLLIITSAVAGGIVGLLGGGFEVGLKAGNLIAILVCLGLSFQILSAKKSISFGNVLLALLAGILAIVGGGLLGLIPVSFLTTKGQFEK